MKRAFQVHPADTVATLLADAEDEPIEIVHAQQRQDLTLRQAIKYGHKVALVDLEAGAPIVKYGIPIGIATCAIHKGEWVHLHNCASAYDARAATLDVESGAATDTPYI
jgi:altronate dehydratase small subunit